MLGGGASDAGDRAAAAAGLVPGEFVTYAKANPWQAHFGFGLGTCPQILGDPSRWVTVRRHLTSIPPQGGAQA